MDVYGYGYTSQQKTFFSVKNKTLNSHDPVYKWLKNRDKKIKVLKSMTCAILTQYHVKISTIKKFMEQDIKSVALKGGY